MSSITWTIEAGPQNRPTAPVQVPWPSDRAPIPAGDVVTLTTDYGNPVIAQLHKTPEGATLTWLVGALRPGEARRYTWTAGGDASPAAPPAGVIVRDDPDSGYAAVTFDGVLQTRYNYRNVIRPYLYPWAGPGGSTLTRHYPMSADMPAEKHDHPHHKSIFFAAHYDINATNTWSEQPGYGWREHTGFESLVSGPVWGRIVATSTILTSGREPVATERLSLTFYPLGGGAVQMDVELTITAAYGELRFGSTKEAGMLAVRVASPMEGNRLGRIENGFGGIGEAQCWGQRAPWCHISGPVSGSAGELTAGIGIIDHPDNPRHPTYWHVRDYGLMTANPFGIRDYKKTHVEGHDGTLTIAAGAQVTFRYRLLSHAGDAQVGQFRERYLDYAFGPKISVN